MRIRIECINKDDRKNPYERILRIGGTNPDGGAWRLSLADAVAGVEAGRYDFYVERPLGDPVNVLVIDRGLGNKYLKTTADGDSPNNLLSLPECP
ncbi:MAG: DUF3892 domain-containing protein [Actinomycetota bacterium]